MMISSSETTRMLPRVRSVAAASNYSLELEFTSGELGVYDCKPLLDFGVFRELRDEEYSRQVRIVNGTVAWPHEQDICPDTLIWIPGERRERLGVHHNARRTLREPEPEGSKAE